MTSNADKRALFDRMALSCLSYLESLDLCQLSDFTCGEGALTHELLMWDKKNAPLKLPKDLKNFYSVFNGVNINYNVSVGEKFVMVGEIQLNRIELIQKMTTIEGVFMQNSWKDIIVSLPDSKSCAAFFLHSVSEVGEVYLLYRQPHNNKQSSTGSESEYIGLINQSGLYENPEIWFVDISQRWHFLCQTFTQYVRLMITHLGEQ